MMTRDKIVEGLRIVEAVDSKGLVWAGHEVLAIAAPGVDLTDEQRERLVELGFQHDEDYGWYCYT